MSLKQNVENGELRNCNVPGGSNLLISGRLELGYEVVTGAGALNPSVPVSFLVTTGANALTLADGTTKGQQKIVTMTTDGGNGTLTPANFKNGTTITFADAADTVTLMWDGTEWVVVSMKFTGASPIA